MQIAFSEFHVLDEYSSNEANFIIAKSIAPSLCKDCLHLEFFPVVGHQISSLGRIEKGYKKYRKKNNGKGFDTNEKEM